MSFSKVPPLVLEIIALLCLKPPKKVVQSLAARPRAWSEGAILRGSDWLQLRVCTLVVVLVYVRRSAAGAGVRSLRVHEI